MVAQAGPILSTSPKGNTAFSRSLWHTSTVEADEDGNGGSRDVNK